MNIPPLNNDLNPAQILEQVNSAVLGKTGSSISNVQMVILLGTLNNKTYGEMSQESGFKPNYLVRDAGPQFWRLLSDVFKTKVNKSNFRTFVKSLNSASIRLPFRQTVEWENSWISYKAWLHKQIQDPMLFDEFGLENIYVPLRAYHRRRVVDLETYVKTWLKEADKNDAIRIISGGPGSGKSSFAKVLAVHHAEENTFPVLFIPLHQFNPSGDLRQAVAEFIQYDEHFTKNPLDPDDHGLRLLIILDGLDELALQGKLVREVAQNFVREVKDEVSRFNRNKTRLQVLFTGREVAVQNSFQDPHQILHVLPYFLPKGKRKSYLDPEQQLDNDQRNEWWQKYGVATQKFYTAMPEEMARGNLTEITAQPLLNYLVALSYVDGKLTLLNETNLNTVYADLLTAVYERGYEDNRKHTALGEMSAAHFRRVLEEIALAAWHGNGRTTTVAEIERHCESSGLKRLLEIFEEGAKVGVTQLLVAFYFRQSGVRGSERTFEFTHKSFGEYLTACRIVRAMERIHRQLERRKDDMEEGWDERQALLHLAEVCGPTRMDTYLLQFLRDEVALRDVEIVKQWQQTFAHLISVMLRQGLPMEKLEPALRFQQMNQWAIHAEEALLVVLSACAQVTLEVLEVDWPSEVAFGTWLKRLQGQRISGDNVVVLESLSYLNLDKLLIQFQDFQKASLQRTSLQGASLQGGALQEADLQEANLQWAKLQGANLQGANLQGANLQGANLQGANLQGANLQGANLQGANLQSICWDNQTNWNRVLGLKKVHNIPKQLGQQLGLTESE